MKLYKRTNCMAFQILFIALFVLIYRIPLVFSYPVEFTDSMGNHTIITQSPIRVVSLVPSVTEIIFKLGAENTLTGITYHSSKLSFRAENKQIVGGFFSPSLEKIEEIDHEIIFVSKLHKEVMERFDDGKCQLINLETESIADSYKNILLLGRIFDKKDNAHRIVATIKGEIEVVLKKVSKIPLSNRKRVVRVMGYNPILVPGDDSFQNEMIRIAGGIPPVLNKKGNIVHITKEEWMRFNPQVIYWCGKNSTIEKKFSDRPGVRDVDAVRDSQIFSFPCDLTCRAATNTGYFISWLSSRIYSDEFIKEGALVLEEKTAGSRRIKIDLDYIKDARILYSTIYDFLNKTLIVDFKMPLSIVSTLEGGRKAIESVGNHYSSPPCWAIGHKLGLEEIRSKVYKVIGRSKDKASFLFTGADMDNLTIKKESFKEMGVYALVTAGVESNAVRMSRDEGRFYEPGTINIIILPNMKLTPRSMTRAIISATEAKTAAIMDMDIRSTYTSTVHQATGTGTDNIIVVQGTGVEIDNTGGHSKMGELIAKAVYAGVKEAIFKQNGLITERNVFQRLTERGVGIFDLVSQVNCECKEKRSSLVSGLEDVLLDSRYASFLESAMVLSDDYEKGLVEDLSSYELWCKMIAQDIAGKRVDEIMDLVEMNDIPSVLKMAFNAILNGVYHEMR